MSETQIEITAKTKEEFEEIQKAVEKLPKSIQEGISHAKKEFDRYIFEIKYILQSSTPTISLPNGIQDINVFKNSIVCFRPGEKYICDINNIANYTITIV